MCSSDLWVNLWVYPQIDPEHPATLSTWILRDILRDEWGYNGVVITDALMMKAIFERYGYVRAAVMAIQAGADMILAQGSLAEQGLSIQALSDALANGALTPEQCHRACARLDALATRYPVRFDDYAGAPREADDQLMRRAWAAGLTALRGAKPPALNAPLRVFVQSEVPTDGVCEAGPSGQQVAKQFTSFTDTQIEFVPNLQAMDWRQVPQDGRRNIVASTHRLRYGSTAKAWPVDLHLVLWNPFQALDVPGPTVVTWGYADGALDALQAWLEGRLEAVAQAPVQLDSL